MSMSSFSLQFWMKEIPLSILNLFVYSFHVFSVKKNEKLYFLLEYRWCKKRNICCPSKFNVEMIFFHTKLFLFIYSR